MITSLKITDGTTTADLTDNANYMLVDGGLDLGIAKLRTSELGGRGPIDEAEGSIIVDVRSEPLDVATTLANIEKLQQLALQCQRWSRGANVAGVYVEIQIGAGTARRCLLTYLDIQPPNTFADLLMVQEVAQVKLAFVRRGAWLSTTTESASATAGSSSTQSVQSVLLPSTINIPAPISIRYGNFDRGAFTSNIVSSGVVLAAVTNGTDVPSGLQIVEGESVSGLTNTSEVTRNASGSAVGRLTTTTTATLNMAMTYLSSVPSQQVTLYAVLRKGDATTTWKLQAQLRRASSFGTPIAAAPVYVDGSSVDPRVVRIGSMANSINARNIECVITNMTGPSASIDIDFFVILQQYNDYAAEVRWDAVDMSGLASGNVSQVVVSSNPLGRTPYVRMENTSNEIAIAGYAGDAYAVMAQDAPNAAQRRLDCTILLTNGTNYRVPVAWQATVTRWPSKLTPQ